MNLESDSEFQAYMSQLIQKTQEFKFEETSSNEISPPSHLESISSDKSDRTKINDPNRISKDNINKPRTLEKSLKRLDREKPTTESFLEQEVSHIAYSDSEAFSKNRPNSKSDKYKTNSSKVSTARSDEILNLNNVMSFNDLVNDMSFNDLVNNENYKTVDEATVLSDTDVLSEEREFGAANKQLPNLNEEENINIFHATNKTELHRQSSTSSLLLPREGVFYADKKRKNSILVFKDEVVWARESKECSNNITESKTSQSESIEEDLPAPEVKFRIKKESKESLLSTVSEKVNKINPIKSVENKRERSTNKNEIKGLMATTVGKTHRSRSNSEQKISHRLRKPSVENSCNISIPSSSKSPTEESTKKSSHRSSKIKPMAASSRENNCKYPSTFSSTCSSSSESTHSSSLSIKIKPKKSKKSRRKKHQRRLKDKNLLVKLIIKTMVKLLPKLQPNLFQEGISYSYPMASLLVSPQIPPMQKSVGITANNMAPMYATPMYHSHASLSTARIDDALRQTISLTHQFLDTHQTLYDAYLNMLKMDSKHSSIGKVEEFLNKKSAPVSLNDAYRAMKELKKTEKGRKTHLK